MLVNKGDTGCWGLFEKREVRYQVHSVCTDIALNLELRLCFMDEKTDFPN